MTEIGVLIAKPHLSLAILRLNDLKNFSRLHDDVKLGILTALSVCNDDLDFEIICELGKEWFDLTNNKIALQSQTDFLRCILGLGNEEPWSNFKNQTLPMLHRLAPGQIEQHQSAWGLAMSFFTSKSMEYKGCEQFHAVPLNFQSFAGYKTPSTCH